MIKYVPGMTTFWSVVIVKLTAEPEEPGRTACDEKAHAAPAGKPEQENATDLAYGPPSGLTETMNPAELPRTTVAAAGEVETEKSTPTPPRATE